MFSECYASFLIQLIGNPPLALPLAICSNTAVTTLESTFNKWKQDPILFIIAVEESADMMGFIEPGTGKRDRSSYAFHGISPNSISSSPWLNKDAPLCAQMSNSYLGRSR
jgi:hypothetical protein